MVQQARTDGPGTAGVQSISHGHLSLMSFRTLLDWPAAVFPPLPPPYRQQYLILFAQRFGNEAVHRSRCRQHADCALRIVATDPPSVFTATSAQGPCSPPPSIQGFPLTTTPCA
mgnify:CR=1 FL=1